MKTISIELENCFGIGKLKHEFDFTETNSFLIYAPNGTMKTSFAKTLDLISKNDKKNQPKDLVNAKKSLFTILSDGKEITPSSILVVNAEDNTFDGTQKITSFIASKELKGRYDNIYNELNALKAELIKKLKKVSNSTNCEDEYLETFSEDVNDNFFSVLSDNIQDLKQEFPKISFAYNHVFDPKGNVKSFLTKNGDLLDSYVNNYNEIISNSKLFKLTGENIFGTYEANAILKSIEDNSYFEAGHKFVLEDGTEINDSQELKKLFEEEVEKIFADQKLKESFDKIDRAIGANAELRNFKRVIERDNSLLIKLKDYNSFKREVWKSFLSEIKVDADDLVANFDEKKEELGNIIKEAGKEVSTWKTIIDKFNTRFYVPFSLKIVNQHDVILKQETANLQFTYDDKYDGSTVQNKENLLKILSKGEQRAYFILQFLFEIESRRSSGDETLLIFDDIADSFDYKNKYAVIEYIQDLHQSALFKSIILTHNFDFYRTLSSRLSIYKFTFIATRDDNKKIELREGMYMNDLFKTFIQKYTDPKVFISLIAFVRNLIEYTDSAKVDDHKLLTSCLHQKENSEAVGINEVFDIFKSRIKKLHEKPAIYSDDEKIFDIIFATAESITKEEPVDEILLENKIVLAVACRLKAEQYMIKKLPNLNLADLGFYQTRELSMHYRELYPESDHLATIDKVNLMTPENIHLNAFMYEPLVDMSVFHLMTLYKNLIQLN